MASNTNLAEDAIKAKNATTLSKIRNAVAAQSDSSQNVTFLLSQIDIALQAQQAAELQVLNIRAAQNGESKTSDLTAAFDQATTARNLQIAQLGDVYANISAYSNASNADVIRLGELAGTGPSSLEASSNAVDGAAAALLVHERTLIIAQRERAHRLRGARDESDIDLAQGRQIIKRFARDGIISDRDAKNVAAELQAQVVNTTRQLHVIRDLIPTPNQPSMFDRISNEPENGDNNNIRASMADDLEDIKEQLRAAILALQDSVFANLPLDAAKTAADLAKQLLDTNASLRSAQDSVMTLRETGGTGGGDLDCEENLRQARAKINDLDQMSLRLRRERDEALQQIKTRQRGIKQLEADLKKVQAKVDNGDTDSAKKDLDNCNEQVKRLEAALEEAKKNNGTKSPEVQKEIDALKLSNDQYKGEIEKLRREVDRLEKLIAKMTKNGFGKDDCEKMLQRIKDELEKEVQKNSELSNLSNNLQTMTNDLRNEITNLKKERDALEEQVKTKSYGGSRESAERIKFLDKVIKAHSAGLKANTAMIGGLNAEKKTLLSQQQDYLKQIEDLKALLARNPQDGLKDCHDQVESLQEQIKQLQIAATENKALINGMKSTKAQNKGDLAARDKTIDDLRTAVVGKENETKHLQDVIDAMKKEAATVEGSPDQIFQLQQQIQRLQERLTDRQRATKVDKANIAQLQNDNKNLQKIIDNQGLDDDRVLAQLQAELKGLREGAELGQNHIEHLDEAIAERNDRIQMLNERVDRRDASIEQLTTAIEAYKEVEDSSNANEANIASLGVQVEHLIEANQAIEAEVENLLGDHQGDHPLTIAIRSRNAAFIEGTRRTTKTKKIRDDLKAKLAACKLTLRSQ